MPGGPMTRALGWLSCASVAWACGSAADPAAGYGTGMAEPTPGPAASSSEPRHPPTLLADSPPAPAGSDPGAPAPAACVTARSEAELVRQPIDIVVLLDNSLSMVDEARSVEATLNVNFASLLEDSGVDAECQADAFVVGADGITLCPAACDRVRADPGAAVEVLFTCESTLILR